MLRCHVNYEALRFTPAIEALGGKIVSVLRKNGFFVVLHLRYEMDMLAFSGCTHGCSDAETDRLTEMRFALILPSVFLCLLAFWILMADWLNLVGFSGMLIHGGKRKR